MPRGQGRGARGSLQQALLGPSPGHRLWPESLASLLSPSVTCPASPFLSEFVPLCKPLDDVLSIPGAPTPPPCDMPSGWPLYAVPVPIQGHGDCVISKSQCGWTLEGDLGSNSNPSNSVTLNKFPSSESYLESGPVPYIGGGTVRSTQVQCSAHGRH